MADDLLPNDWLDGDFNCPIFPKNIRASEDTLRRAAKILCLDCNPDEDPAVILRDALLMADRERRADRLNKRAERLRQSV